MINKLNLEKLDENFIKKSKFRKLYNPVIEFRFPCGRLINESGRMLGYHGFYKVNCPCGICELYLNFI